MVAPYIITGERGQTDKKSFARPSEADAVEKASELAEMGYTKIRIIDAEGRVYTPAEFRQLVKS